MPVRIGELLLKEKRITPAQLQEALTYQKTSGGKLGFNLVKLGFVKDEEITALLSKQYGVPSINLAQFEIDPAIVKLIPAETAHKYGLVNHVVPRDQLMAKAREVADRICKNAPLAVRESRAIAAAALDMTEEEAWKKSNEASGRIFRTEDAMEGPTAFAQKREPQWKGR